ncbi:MAG: biopolymer transporter ExbD [Gammaproteobacteria bacterium]|nr:biopolymer transporter ExbD [Gammaproteobacteria bacterium]NND59830.1 biopolymer transporter ExbD [Gammaproteobacteria bacterium]
MRRMFGNLEEEEESRIDITPMLDVVFILLIFFIVTASFIRETGIDLNRPDAPAVQTEEKANILIDIDGNNEIFIRGRIIDVRRVRANIERLRAENPEASVVVAAHPDSRNELLVQVMDASREAGVYNISIAQ